MQKSALMLALLLLIGMIAVTSPSVQAQTEEPNNQRHLRATPTPTPPTEGMQPQIVGGNPADDGEYPWQVAIVEAGQSNPFYGQFCGGSLIAPAWVLTAAHCVQDDGVVESAANLDVVAGINRLSQGPTSGSQGQRRKVSQIIVHPSYNENNFDNDLALLRLVAPFDLGAKIQTLPFVTPADAARFAAGEMATVAGWGRINPPPLEPIQWPDDLMEVDVPIVAQSICNTAYAGGITANMICAGYASGGKDSCQGDSGGPLIVPDGSGGWLQAGIVSWGDGCALPSKYGVYTRLANYTAWINYYLNPPFVAYLPLVIKTAAATPSGIPNGDFEQGRTAWTEYSSNGYPLIVRRTQMPSGISPHGGDWAAWLGGDYDELSRLYQTVTIDNSTPYLVFWHLIDSLDPCGLDVAGVKVNNQTVKHYDLCQPKNTSWKRQVLDLSSYTGQSVQLEFFAQNTAMTDSWWFLDDITLQAVP